MPFNVQILLNDHQLVQVRAHLLPPGNEVEQAGFGFALPERTEGSVSLRLLEWLPVVREDLDAQSDAYLELRDGVAAKVIKRAHDLEACLIEFHCHMGPWPAMFSPSDLLGFREFVPHVWWRLKRRPYAAVVVTAEKFDGLAWIDSPERPVALDLMTTPTETYRATGLTIRSLKGGRRVAL